LSSRKTARSISAWDDPDFEVDILRSLLTLVKNLHRRPYFSRAHVSWLRARARELGKLEIHGPGSGACGSGSPAASEAAPENGTSVKVEVCFMNARRSGQDEQEG
jgi:hypothetical protein